MCINKRFGHQAKTRVNSLNANEQVSKWVGTAMLKYLVFDLKNRRVTKWGSAGRPVYGTVTTVSPLKESQM